MVDKLKALQSQQLITIQDAAVVTWEVSKKKPKTRPAEQSGWAFGARRRLLGDAVRAALLRPVAGSGDRRRHRALTGSMSDVGIDDKFINGVKQRVTPGTSALSCSPPTLSRTALRPR